jgi:hypothetical protein
MQIPKEVYLLHEMWKIELTSVDEEKNSKGSKKVIMKYQQQK